uniref:RNA helicase n=1 Tax=Panagrolaimus sp. PS1159 TaxID=55785 RepID=A0AC35FHQ5_9BILA
MESSDEEHANDGSSEMPPKKRHVPKARTVEELFDDDEKASAHYAGIKNYDDDIEYDDFRGTVSRIETWEDAELHPQILKNLKEHSKYVRPRKIQSAAMPFIFDGFDVKVQAETGSGKTLAYLLPVIDKCIRAKLDRSYISKPSSPYTIIICPTRELVLQIFEQATKFSYRINVKIAKAYGEYDVRQNVLEITNGCDVLIATPGRLKHFIFDDIINVKHLKCLVLDEVDVLLTDSTSLREGFIEVLKEIIGFPGFPDISARQTLLFSATFLPKVMKNADIFVQNDATFVTNYKNNPNRRVIQDFISAYTDVQKFDKLSILISNEIKEVGDPKKLRRTLIFTNTRDRSFVVASHLEKYGIEATPMNADRTQDSRENVFNDFRDGKINLVVASDLCCRGLDIKDLHHVINFDMPQDIPTYLYRIGRTGRITQGFATSFITARDVVIAYEIAGRIQENSEIIPQSLKDIIEKTHRRPANELAYNYNDNGSNISFGYQSFEDIPFAVSEASESDGWSETGGTQSFESLRISDT